MTKRRKVSRRKVSRRKVSRRKVSRRKVSRRTVSRRRAPKQFYGGGHWITQDMVLADGIDTCKICDRKFQDTKELAIYQLDCGHRFHNNCLDDNCGNINTRNCLVCGTYISDDECTNVYAFKNKDMNEAHFIDQLEIQDLYKNQELARVVQPRGAFVPRELMRE